MRGNRTWFAVVTGWLLIGFLLIFGGFGLYTFCASIFLILFSYFLVNGEMKWWREDISNFDAAIGKLQRTGKQIAHYRSLLTEKGVTLPED